MRTLARQRGQAIERARLYEQEHEVAVALQRSLLPRRLPVRDALRLAAVYRPGNQGLNVGGDWYDALDLTDGRIAAGSVRERDRASGRRRDRFVDVEARLAGREIRLRIRDTGTWRSEAEVPRRGRGLMLIQSVMDDVAITRSRAGTELRMTRHLQGEAAQQP